METSIVRSSEDIPSTPVCFGCNRAIKDQYLLKVVERLWHERCVRCYECQTILNGKCFSRNNHLYCKPDFYRLFGVKCAGCHEGIYPSDMVRRLPNRIFHTSCLKCQHCDKEVATGDQLFVIEDGSFVCKTDYGKIKSCGGELEKVSPTSQKASPCSATESDELDDKPPSTSSMNEQQLSDEDDDSNRRRGPRTTIKAKQLEVLKSAFLTTPKPSRNIREKLAADTGLTMRVIQVWFQNRRSKERRVKQISTQDIRRTFQKNTLTKDTTNGNVCTYFQNGSQTPNMDDYTHNAFNFNSFNNNNNNNNYSSTSNNNNLSMPLPNDILQNANALKDKFNDDSADFNILSSFTSQIQTNNFSGYNFSTQILSTYEKLQSL